MSSGFLKTMAPATSLTRYVGPSVISDSVLTRVLRYDDDDDDDDRRHKHTCARSALESSQVQASLSCASRTTYAAVAIACAACEDGYTAIFTALAGYFLECHPHMSLFDYCFCMIR
jgi:hypothetical protein